MSGFQSFFRFKPHFVLAKLATSSRRVKTEMPGIIGRVHDERTLATLALTMCVCCLRPSCCCRWDSLITMAYQYREGVAHHYRAS